MATITITTAYSDGNLLTEAHLDTFKTSVEAFLNTTKLNDDNIQAAGITGSARLKNTSVSPAKLADGSVLESKITSLAVTTIKLLDDAVTTDKIDDLAVTSAKLDPALEVEFAKRGERDFVQVDYEDDDYVVGSEDLVEADTDLASFIEFTPSDSSVGIPPADDSEVERNGVPTAILVTRRTVLVTVMPGFNEGYEFYFRSSSTQPIFIDLYKTEIDPSAWAARPNADGLTGYTKISEQRIRLLANGTTGNGATTQWPSSSIKFIDTAATPGKIAIYKISFRGGWRRRGMYTVLPFVLGAVNL